MSTLRDSKSILQVEGSATEAEEGAITPGKHDGLT